MDSCSRFLFISADLLYLDSKYARTCGRNFVRHKPNLGMVTAPFLAPARRRFAKQISIFAIESGAVIGYIAELVTWCLHTLLIIRQDCDLLEKWRFVCVRPRNSRHVVCSGIDGDLWCITLF